MSSNSNNIPHNPPQAFELVCDWHEKSIVDYRDHYLPLYIAYNTWYREVTGESNDRRALTLMKKRHVMWEDYMDGKVLKGLEPYMVRLVDLTQKEPLRHFSAQWSGELADRYDFRGLIEYWYQVRCLLVHGAKVQPAHVWLAYETLDIYMREIIKRTRACMNSEKYKQVKKAAHILTSSSSSNDKFLQLQQKLYQKYIALPDIWQVDMQRE